MKSLLRTTLDINICTLRLFVPPFNVGSGRNRPELGECSAARRTMDFATLKGGGPSVQILMTKLVRKESGRPKPSKSPLLLQVMSQGVLPIWVVVWVVAPYFQEKEKSFSSNEQQLPEQLPKTNTCVLHVFYHIQATCSMQNATMRPWRAPGH